MTVYLAISSFTWKIEKISRFIREILTDESQMNNFRTNIPQKGHIKNVAKSRLTIRELFVKHTSNSRGKQASRKNHAIRPIYVIIAYKLRKICINCVNFHWQKYGAAQNRNHVKTSMSKSSTEIRAHSRMKNVCIGMNNVYRACITFNDSFICGICANCTQCDIVFRIMLQ